MYPTTNTWNRDFIVSIMNTQDTSNIYKLPLHSRTDSDTIIYNASLNGSYTVRFAYNMCVSISDQQYVSGDWKLIWSLHVPPKIKHFCRRLFRNCLPTRFNSQGRGVHCQSACVACNNVLEDEMHLFMHCKFAIDCWEAANRWGMIAPYIAFSGNIFSIIFSILRALGVENCARFVAILCSIWRAHNACLWEQKPFHVNTSCVIALDIVRDFKWCNRPNDNV
jgi:hypothetical protein